MSSSFDRVMATFRHELSDCVPAFPILLMQGAVELEVDLPTYFSRGNYWAEGQLRLLDKFRHDCVLGIPHVVQDTSAFGASLVYYENGPPSVGEMIIHRYADVGRLVIPDPTSTPLLAETLAAIEILNSEVGGEVPILGACIAPFSLPSMLMGTELWMQLLFLEPDDVRDEVMGYLLEVTAEFCVAWANAQLAAGADAIILADGMASAAVLNREQFQRFALPVIQATVPRIEGSVIHEGVGHLHPMLDLLVGTGLAGVMLTSLDDLTRARTVTRGTLTLIGNLNNLEMRHWSADQMTVYARKALDEAAGEGGFILSAQGPEIPLGVPEDVIQAMVQAAHHWRP